MYSSKKKENRRSGRLLTLVLLALAMPLLAQETTLEDPILSDTAEAAISLYYEPHLGTESVGLYPDGSNEVYVMTTPTIAQSNTINSYATWLEQPVIAH